MNVYRLCVLGLLVLSPVSISNLNAKTETTPLNELSHPDERALYCKIALAQRMTIFMSRKKNMVEAMNTIQVIQSWDAEINRILGKDESYKKVSLNVNAHWAKHFGTYVKNASDAEIKERMKILDKEAVNCQDELTKYKKRSKPTPYAVAKKDTKSLTSSPMIPAQNKSVQKKPTPKKTAQKTKAQPKQTDYVGNWIGAVKQPGAVAYSVEMNIRLDNENKLVGVSNYPELKCSGSLTLDNSPKNSSISFFESKGNASYCAATGKIKLTQNDDGSVNWQWFYSNGRLGATAKIIKTKVSARMAQLLQPKNMPKEVAKVKTKEPQKVAISQGPKKSTKISTKTPIKVKQRKDNKTALNVNSFTSKGLNYESELMAIYLGDFKHARLKRGGLAVSGMFRKYLLAYGKFCYAYLPKDKVPITVRRCARESVTTNGLGVETNRSCVEWVDVPTGLYADPNLYYSSNRASRQAGKQVLGTMFNFKDPYGSRALADDAISLGNDMENLVQKNKCNSIGIRRFEKNLNRFAENKSPLMLPGKQTLASTMSNQPVSFNAASLNIKSLIDDLIQENAKGWMMNRYRSGSVSNLTVQSRNSNGSPRLVHAKYVYDGMGKMFTGTVSLSFANNLPQCLYFSDAPKTCRHPSRRIINNYERGKYSK